MLSTEQLNWFLNRLKRKVDKLSFALGTMEDRFLPGKVVDSIPSNPVPDNVYFDKGYGRIAMPDGSGGFVDFGGSMDGYSHVQVADLPATLAPNTVYFVANGGNVVVTDANGNPTEYGGSSDYAVFEYFKYNTGFKLENSGGTVKDIAAFEHHYIRVSNDIKTLSVSGAFYPQDDVLLKSIDIKFVGTYGKNRFKLFVAEAVDFNGAINTVTSLVPYLSTIYESPEFDVFGRQEKTFYHKSFDVGVQLNKGGVYIIYFKGLGLDSDGDYTRVYYGVSINLTLKGIK